MNKNTGTAIMLGFISLIFLGVGTKTGKEAIKRFGKEMENKI